MSGIAQRLLIFGYYGWKNTGDDAMLYAILRELLASSPRRRIAIVAQGQVEVPEEASGFVKFVKLNLHAVLRELFSSSVFLIGGGTHIEDHGARRIRPLRNIIRIFSLTVVAKLLRKDIYFLAVGIGPISTIWEKMFLAAICQLANFISVRDEKSYGIITSLGARAKCQLAFDASILLDLFCNGNPVLLSNKPSGSKVIGLSVLPVFEIYNRETEKDILLVREIAKAVNKCMSEDPVVTVHLFVFKGQSKDDDVAMTKLLHTQLRPHERVKLVPYESDPRKTLHELSQCCCFVGMRFHSCLFAYLSGVPLLMIDYHPKCKALARYIGLPENAIVSPGEILTGQLYPYLKHLHECPSDFRATLPVEIARMRARRGLSPLCESRSVSRLN